MAGLNCEALSDVWNWWNRRKELNFDESFTALIGNEGGFTNDPKDRGNWTGGQVGKGILKGTKYGVTAMMYPSLDIENLTLEQAKSIYKHDYWDKTSNDLLPMAIRFDMFDMSVNSSVHNAAIALQKSVNTQADGSIGALTIATINALDPQLVDKRFAAQRLLFLAAIGTWPSYGKGWVVRVANNLMKD